MTLARTLAADPVAKAAECLRMAVVIACAAALILAEQAFPLT